MVIDLFFCNHMRLSEELLACDLLNMQLTKLPSRHRQLQKYRQSDKRSPKLNCILNDQWFGQSQGLQALETQQKV